MRRARGIGMDAEVISPDEAVKIMPQITKKDLFGAMYLPRRASRPVHDHHFDGRFAWELGVTIYTHTRVTGIELSPKGEVTRVLTDKARSEHPSWSMPPGCGVRRLRPSPGRYPTTPVDHQHVVSKRWRGTSLVTIPPACATRTIWSTCAGAGRTGGRRL